MRYKWGIFLIIVLLLLPSWGFSLCEARILQKGMSGVDVQDLQIILYRLGHEIRVDGFFGSETEVLVKRIQKSMGLKADGVVGHLTLEILDRLEDNNVLTYTVEGGDNLTLLASRYATTVQDISNYNRLANPDRILPGQVLYIPLTNLTVFSSKLKSQSFFQWPVKGRISSGYGYRIHPITQKRQFHGGIDIAVPEGTPVKAAAAGKVIQADVLGSLGLSVVIKHANGLTTWYGHNSRLNVHVGNNVQSGEIIAYVGKTGLATGSHLDFRIKIGDRTLDPMKWLP